MTPAEGREQDACRALRGAPLCQEVYGLDGTSAETAPYLVTESQSEVRVLHRGPSERQTVFTVLPRQSRSFHAEREGTNARVVRELTL